jgi:uroporphyrinogen decarboxylase
MIEVAYDRFLRACRGEPVDATPVWFMRQAGRSLPEYRAIREHATLLEITCDPALCAEVTLQPVRRLGVDAAILFADITTPLPGIGATLDIKDGVGPLIDRPVRSGDDIRALRPFEPEIAVGPLLDAIRLVRAASPVPLIGFAGAPFTLASYLVEGRSSPDAHRLKTLIHEEAALAGELFERLTDMTIAYLRAQVDAGVQAVQVFDSWVGALSPFDYERSVLPHMLRLFEAVDQLGVPTIHFGTGAAGLLGLMAQSGADVIGVDWRIALAEAWDAAGSRAIMGNLDPALLLGPWPAVAEQTRWILDQVAGRRGHIFNLGHGVLPATNPDDLRALVGLVHDRSSALSAEPQTTSAPAADGLPA